MPTYEYECSVCKTSIEEFHSINETPDIICPDCKSKMNKIISSGASIVFKGTGFYVTDYPKDKGKTNKEE